MLNSNLKNYYLKLQNALRNFSSNVRGAVGIEFALIMPFFLLMMATVLEVAAMLFLEHALQGGVQEAARKVRTGQAQNANMTPALFRDEICKFVPFSDSCAANLKVYVNAANSFAALQTSIVSPGAIDVPLTPGGPIPTPPFVCGNAQQVVAVMATYDYKFVFFYMKPFGNILNNSGRRLVGYAIFRNEPFPASGSCGV